MKKGAKDELIRTEILAAAQKLFQQFGINKTTMEDIAQAAGKGKSTLYYYFKSKEEIFDAVLFLEMDDVFSITQNAIEKAVKAEDKIRQFALTKFKVVQEKSNLYSIVGGEFKEDLQIITKIRNKYNQREFNLVKGILEFGVKSSEFIKLNPTDLEYTTFAIISALRGIKMNLYFEDKCEDVELYLEHLINMLLKSIKKQDIKQENKLTEAIYN